jgi:hypothetical protein
MFRELFSFGEKKEGDTINPLEEKKGDLQADPQATKAKEELLKLQDKKYTEQGVTKEEDERIKGLRKLLTTFETEGKIPHTETRPAVNEDMWDESRGLDHAKGKRGAL